MLMGLGARQALTRIASLACFSADFELSWHSALHRILMLHQQSSSLSWTLRLRPYATVKNIQGAMAKSIQGVLQGRAVWMMLHWLRQRGWECL